MDRKYQIFISSTFADLKEERRIVMETILKFGHIPVGMEMFKAGNESQWKIIEERIRDCDYYLVIVGDRYGTTDEQGKSYTEREYDFAVENGIPVAAFLTDKGVRAAPGRQLDDLEDALKLERFRRKCSAGKVVAFWGTPDRLALECMASLHELTTKYPRPGWISGRNAAGPEVLTQFAKMAAENEQLRTQLDEANRMLAKQSQEVEIDYMIKQLETFTLEIKDFSFIEGSTHAIVAPDQEIKDLALKIRVPAIELMRKLARPMIDGVHTYEINEVLSVLFESRIALLIDERVGLIKYKSLDVKCVNMEVLIDFLRMNDYMELVDRDMSYAGYSDYVPVLRLTEKGRRLGRRLFVLES